MIRRVLAVGFLSLQAALLFVSCDESPSYCRVPCDTDAECKALSEIARCDDGHCLYEECQSDQDCDTGQGEGCLHVQDVKFCRATCSADSDCFDPEFCMELEDGRRTCLGDCVEIGCVEGQTCNADTRLCECSADDQCFGGVCE